MGILLVLFLLFAQVPAGPLQDVVQDYFSTREIAEMPPLVLVPTRPPGAASDCEGFVEADRGTVIYIPTYSDVYQAALLDRFEALEARKRLAGVIAHEWYHIKHHGEGEFGAYDAQILKLLNVHASESTLRAVRRAQQHYRPQ